jgi:hypothetical protein
MVSVIAIICVPFVEINGAIGQRIAAYTVATLFWIGLVLELIMVRKCSCEREKLEQRESEDTIHSNIGIISFAKTQEGRTADIVLVLALIVNLFLRIIKRNTEWISISCISVLYLSFHLHCLLNGKNYRYIKLFTTCKKGRRQNE